MVATKLKGRELMLSFERNASVYGTTALVTDSFTPPANTGDLLCYPSAACHWNPNGAATSSFMHAVAANEMFRIPHKHIATAQIIGDGGSFTMIIGYERGAGRADGGGSVARPAV